MKSKIKRFKTVGLCPTPRKGTRPLGPLHLEEFMEIGQVVFSKCGRDKGRAFVVLSVEGDYIFLADGHLRPLNKPKKKKVRHVQPTNTVMNLHQAVGGLKDADIRKWLNFTCQKEEVSNCLRTM